MNKNQIREVAVQKVRSNRSPIAIFLLVILVLFIFGQIIAGPGSWPFVIGLLFLALFVHLGQTHYGKSFLAFILLTLAFIGFLYVKGVSASSNETVAAPNIIETQPQVIESPTEKPKAEKAVSKAKSTKKTCKELKKFDKNIQQWCDLIKKYSAKYGHDPVLVASIIQVESLGNPGSESDQGAVGIMQVMPKEYFWDRPTREELFIPKINIQTGCRVLREKIDGYGSLRDGIMRYGPMDYGYIYADEVLAIYHEKSKK